MHLWWDTLRALAAPRRAVPIAVVSAPLLLAQAWFSQHSAAAVGVALGMVALFVTTAPAAWRLAFPPDRVFPPLQTAGRLLAYAALGALPAWLAFTVPLAVGFEDLFLGSAINALVCSALFWVGGWGLARDVAQEASLATERARLAAAEEALGHARLLATRSHFDPHFLFNTLNALAEWTREDPELAERGILRLARLLREILAGIRAERWPLSDELAIVEDLWALHQLRDPSWFTVAREIGAIDGVQVPPLLLLPLAENAVKHGPARGRRGPLRLQVRRREGCTEITIANPGPWGGDRPGSEGLPSVRQRLALTYGPRGELICGDRDGEAVVTLILPDRGSEPRAPRVG
jgi:two-component system sensor histidine kinase AlgZ